MADKDKKPSIRFKGFTDAWEQRKLIEVVSVYDGVHQTPDYKESGVMFLSVENIATLKSDKYISEEAFLKDYKVYPQKGDVLMTRIGDVGTPNVVESLERVAFYVSLALLKPINIDSYFLCNSIQSPLFKKGLKDRTLVTAIPQKINKDEIGKVDIWVPVSKTEQQQIGTYFQRLDNLITLHQRKYDALVNVKKSMLEKMFPKNGSSIPEIRFKGFTDAWEQRKLGDEISFLKDGTHGTHQDSETGPYLLSAKNIKHGRVIIDDFSDRKISEEEFNQIHSKFKLELGDVLLTIVGSIGETAILENTGDFTFQRSVAFLRPGDNLTSRFLKTEIESTQFQKELNDRKSQSAQPGVYLGDLSKIPLFITSIEEQEKIGDYFANLDSLITLHQRELEKLQNFKKACLQKMFV